MPIQSYTQPAQPAPTQGAQPNVPAEQTIFQPPTAEEIPDEPLPFPTLGSGVITPVAPAKNSGRVKQATHVKSDDSDSLFKKLYR